MIKDNIYQIFIKKISFNSFIYLFKNFKILLLKHVLLYFK